MARSAQDPVAAFCWKREEYVQYRSVLTWIITVLSKKCKEEEIEVMRWVEMTKEVIHYSSLVTTDDLRLLL